MNSDGAHPSIHIYMERSLPNRAPASVRELCDGQGSSDDFDVCNFDETFDNAANPSVSSVIFIETIPMFMVIIIIVWVPYRLPDPAVAVLHANGGRDALNLRSEPSN